MPFALSYRDLVLVADERGLAIAHTTIYFKISNFGEESNLRRSVEDRITNLVIINPLKFLCFYGIV